MTENKKTVKQLLSLIEKVEEKKEKCTQDCQDLETELFDACTHPKEEVLGAQKKLPWVRGTQFRVCKICGYAEEGINGYAKDGWGTGYRKLNYNDGEVLHVEREEAERYVRRLFSQEDLRKVC